MPPRADPALKTIALMRSRKIVALVNAGPTEETDQTWGTGHTGKFLDRPRLLDQQRGAEEVAVETASEEVEHGDTVLDVQLEQIGRSRTAWFRALESEPR
jgi:hypothetical protein